MRFMARKAGSRWLMANGKWRGAKSKEHRARSREQMADGREQEWVGASPRASPAEAGSREYGGGEVTNP